MEQAQIISAASDLFSSVFGNRRGSEDAQTQRDRDELRDGMIGQINAFLDPGMRLTPENLAKLLTAFSDEDDFIQKALRDTILSNISSNGFEDVARRLIFPGVTSLPPGVARMLRWAATQYVENYTKSRAQGAAKNFFTEEKANWIDYLTDNLFSFDRAPFSLREAKEHAEMILAIAKFYRKATIRVGRLTEILRDVRSQPDSHLPLYEPLIAFVENAVKGIASQTAKDGADPTLGGNVLAELKSILPTEQEMTDVQRALFSRLLRIVEGS